MAAAVNGEPKPLVATPAHELAARLSTDERWMAYQSDESGREEVYIRPFPNVNDGKWAVSTRGGLAPVWSRDGRELFYMSGSTMMAVPIEHRGGALDIGVPAPLFDGPFDTGSSNFDVAPDGTFIMVEADPQTALTQMQIVQNWIHDVKRLAAAK